MRNLAVLIPRNLIALIPLLSSLGCVGIRRSALPVPEPLVVDSGAAVRVRLNTDDVIVGRLLAAFTPTSAELIVCDNARRELCDTLDARGVRRLAVGELRGVAIRGKQGSDYMFLGVYLGAITGAVAYRDSAGGSLAAGAIAGAALGYLIGSRVTGWVPLFPCPAHGQCAWRGGWPAARPPGQR